MSYKEDILQLLCEEKWKWICLLVSAGHIPYPEAYKVGFMSPFLLL